MPQLSRAKLKLFASLHQKKYRRQEGLFLAEGKKMVEEAFKSPVEVQAVVYLKGQEVEWPGGFSEEKVYEADRDQIKRLSGQVHPEGVLAVLSIPPVPHYQHLKQLPSPPPGPAFLLDNLQDPGNLGTLLRTADWFGFQQVICSSDTADVFNPKVVRASMGSLFRLHIAYVEDFEGCVRENAERIWMADMAGAPLDEATLPGRDLVLMGNEAKGIRPELRSLPGIAPLTIPRTGAAESLNVGVAAGIIAAMWRMQAGPSPTTS